MRAVAAGRCSAQLPDVAESCVLCAPRPAMLSAGCDYFRPILDPDLAQFRAEPVRTTLGAALCRRPGAAARALALGPLRWYYLLTGPSLSHLDFLEHLKGAAHKQVE
jgi:hypothetical protein